MTAPCREFGGHVSEVQKTGKGLRFEISLTATYNDWNPHDRILWTKHQKAVFIKTRNKQSVLDVSQSDISRRELESVYNIDTLTDSDMYKFNAKEIRASGWKKPGNRSQ